MKLVLILYLLSGLGNLLQNSSELSASPVAQHLECLENERLVASSSQGQTMLKRQAENLQRDTCFNAAAVFVFIETMLKYDAEAFYEIAQQFYFQALSKPFTSTNFHLVEKEARKIMPLLLPSEQKQWEKKIKLQAPSLPNDIHQFWTLHDPVLTTHTNERLIEHWERIAYARKKYTENRDSMYETDDRGMIYVKFGAPTYTRSGLLRPEPTDIRARLYDLSAHKGGLTPEEMFNLNMSIKQNFTPREYEVWIYENLSSPHRVLYIFGESADNGTYGLRSSLEEFIPTNIFNRGISSSWRYDTGPRGLTAGPFLQTALYSALSTVDIYFGQQLLYYDSNWDDFFLGNANFTRLKIQNNRLRAETELRRLQDRAPAHYSTVQNNLGYLNHSFLAYRFLDTHFKPIYRLLVFAQPGEHLLEYDRQRIPNQQPQYRIDHVLKIASQASDPAYFHKLSPLENEKGLTGYLLQIPDSLLSDSLQTVQIASEVKRYTQSPTNNKVRVMIIASKVSDFERPLSLKSTTGTLNVSDLLWGYKPATKNHDIEEITFAVPPDGTIPAGKNLTIYFETYHTSSPSNGLYSYQLEYEIKRIEKRNLVDRGIKLSLSFESRIPVTGESLEIDTSQLESGRYRAIFRFGKESFPASAWIDRSFDFIIRE